jgi:hypothetical protein
MQGEYNADSLYPVDSQPGLWRNLFDYVMSHVKMQEPTTEALLSRCMSRRLGDAVLSGVSLTTGALAGEPVARETPL